MDLHSVLRLDGSTARRLDGCASDRVLRRHGTVRGEYVDGHGVARGYAANDPELLRWVHIASTDAFLSAHKLWGGPIPGGPDAYVRDWAQAGRLMGVDGPPLSEAEMRQQLDRWYDNGELRSDARVAETVAFIRNPPLHPAFRRGYRVLFAAAVTSREPKYRELLGLRAARLGPSRGGGTGHQGGTRRRPPGPGPGGAQRTGCPEPPRQAGLPALSRARRARHAAEVRRRKKAPVRGTGAKRGEWGI